MLVPRLAAKVAPAPGPQTSSVSTAIPEGSLSDGVLPRRPSGAQQSDARKDPVRQLPVAAAGPATLGQPRPPGEEPAASGDRDQAGGRAAEGGRAGPLAAGPPIIGLQLDELTAKLLRRDRLAGGKDRQLPASFRLGETFRSPDLDSRGLHPLWLTFRAPALEASYMRVHAKVAMRLSMPTMTFLNLVLFLVSVWLWAAFSRPDMSSAQPSMPDLSAGGSEGVSTAAFNNPDLAMLYSPMTLSLTALSSITVILGLLLMLGSRSRQVRFGR